jgi:Asp-tRNA(Asn)/Glu-tRNA(Gln) amidotransferase A subunit family amidase
MDIDSYGFFLISRDYLMNAKKKLLLSLVPLMLTACQDSSFVNDSSENKSSLNKISPLRDSALRSMTAYEILPRLKSGEISVLDYMDVLLAQTSKYDDALKAFITIDPQAVREQAKAADEKRKSGVALGPLFGIPVSLKDLISTKDLATSFGTKKFAGFRPDKNAPLVDHLMAADAILFGKNNAQEWAYGSNGYNAHYGQQLNPYDLSRIAGGSSGGGVAAVASRMLPIAIGSDTAASIRVPAAYTGLYGLRPTTGRYDNSGVAPLAPTLDTVGPMARSVADLAIVDSVLSEDFSDLAMIDLSGLRLGIPKAFFHAGVSTEMLAAFGSLLKKLRKAGVVLVEQDLSKAQELNDAGLYPILFYESYPSIAEFLETWGDGTSVAELYAELGADIKAMWGQLVMPGAPGAISEEVYNAAINQARPAMQESYRSYFEKHNVLALLFPATASEAPLASPDNPQQTIIDGETVSIFINDHNSSPGALAGQPGIVMPLALNAQGLPLAVSLDGKSGQDRELMAVAKAIDRLIDPLPAPAIAQ